VISVAVLVMPARLAATEIPLAGEYEIKAAFLVNFSQFVEWPADVLDGAGGPIVIGVAGGDPFGATLDAVAAGRQVDGRPIVVRRVTTADDAAHCHVLFIGAATDAELLSKVAGRSILTVGEAAGFMHRGGIIELFVQDQKVRFAINLEAATAARLKVSSRLAQLAGTRNGIEPVRR
jgi:hypothetical protein